MRSLSLHDLLQTWAQSTQELFLVWFTCGGMKSSSDLYLSCICQFSEQIQGLDCCVLPSFKETVYLTIPHSPWVIKIHSIGNICITSRAATQFLPKQSLHELSVSSAKKSADLAINACLEKLEHWIQLEGLQKNVTAFLDNDGCCLPRTPFEAIEPVDNIILCHKLLGSGVMLIDHMNNLEQM